MRTAVLIAGAGPVGLTLAAELVRYGIAVRIFDKAAARTDKSKALVIWSRTLELLDRAGCGERFVEAGLKAPAANIVVGTEPIGRVTFDAVESPHPYALMIPQSETERLLEEHLGRLGVRVERGVELLSFLEQDNAVQAALRLADGTEETVEATWLAGCDGAHSTVRHGLGVDFEGDTLPSDWVLADVHMTGMPTPGEVYLGWHEEGMIAIFPIIGDRYRVIADAGQGHPHRPDPTLEEMQEILDRRGPGGIRLSDPVWLAAFHINERKVKDYRVGRVFLAGDAAHVHSPAGGQGMNTGMQDACNLAWKLALVERGICAEEPLLGSYSPERSAVGEQVLKDAGRLTSVGILKGGLEQAIRNHAAHAVLGLSRVREAMADKLTEVAIGYPQSPLNLGHGHAPKPGECAPIRPGEALVGAGDTPRFVLFADGEEAFELASHWPQLLETQVRAPYRDGGVWLVRPDGYVAVAGTNVAEAGKFLSSVAATR